MEMGATWFSKPHQHLIALLNELNIEYFKQHTKASLFLKPCPLCLRKNLKFQMPKNLLSNSRWNGHINEKLVAEVGIQNIKTQTKVTAIKDDHL
jgi:monoamine oxidase